MTYSTVLELFGAIERGRVDRERFHNTCAHFLTCLKSIGAADVTWFVDVDHVYAESRKEDELFKWVSKLCEAGVKNVVNKPTLPWAIRGAIVDGSLGMQSTQQGLTTSTDLGVFAELRTSLRSFNGIGVRVNYAPASSSAQKWIFSNVLWTGHSDLPYALFTDVRPAAKDIQTDRLQVLTELAMAAASYSKTMSRSYVPAITKIILNNDRLDLEETVSMLSAARSVEGIELAGLMLINRAYNHRDLNPSASEALVSFPRLSVLCKRLQEKHAFPIGLVQKDAVGWYLSQTQWSHQYTSNRANNVKTVKPRGRTNKP